jgi:hypothetical protein
MGYYAILDRVPKGRDEGDAFQTWLRRRDEYPSGPDTAGQRNMSEGGMSA